jgi:Crp-like helix-turn-helix domain
MKEHGFSETEFNLSMPRTDLANYLGLAPATLSRILTRFEQEGLLHVDRRHIRITSLPRLHASVRRCERGESLFLRKLVLGIPAQASGKNLTRPLMPSAPRPPCVRAAPPHHRKLGAGYAALPQMARRDCSDAYFVFPLALVPRTTEKQCGLIATGD